MKDFLSLINYSLEGNKRWYKDRVFALKYVLLFIFFFLSWMIFVSDESGEIPFTEIIMYAFGIMTAIVGTAYCVKPSMLRLFPMSYKKRVAYYYASIVIYSIIALAVVLACIMIIFVTIGLATYYIDGENFMQNEVNALFAYGVNEYLFSVFKAIFTVSLISIASRLEKKREVIIAFVVLYVTHFVGAIVLANLVKANGGFIVNIYPYFNTLPNPVLAVILSAVFAVLAFALSFAFIVYKEKPQKI